MSRVGPIVLTAIHLRQKYSDDLKKMSILSLKYPIMRKMYQHKRSDGESYVVTRNTKKVPTNIHWHITSQCLN